MTELVATAVLERALDDDVRQAYHRGRAGRLGRAAKASTAAGAGLLLVAGHCRRAPQAVGAVLVLAGSAAERFAVFEAGIESAADPVLTVAPQRRRLAASPG